MYVDGARAIESGSDNLKLTSEAETSEVQATYLL